LTTKNLTGLLSNASPDAQQGLRTPGERLFQLAFGAIQWPWLLKSLYGGPPAERQALLARLELPPEALPHLGSWKADSYLLHRIVDEVERLKPRHVVELGSGASSLIIARALARSSGGLLHSYDQHQPYVASMGDWLAEQGLAAEFRHAPLSFRDPAWPGLWYELADVPPAIDLLVIDGPPWTIHPYARGMAERLFDRLTPGGVVLLDDAARPGERVVARRWRRRWPDISFSYEGGGSKGLLVGRKKPDA
jgi:hypothetical protein